MARRDTLNRNKCKKCEKLFVVGAEQKLLEDYCGSCKTKGWQEDMYKQGCDVIHPDHLGKLPMLTKLKTEECKKIKVGDIDYRDTTKMLFQDTLYKRDYSNQAKRKKEIKQQQRQYEKKMSKARYCKECTKLEIDKGYDYSLASTKNQREYTKSDVDTIISLRREGATFKEIALKINRSEGSIAGKVARLRREGVKIPASVSCNKRGGGC